VSVFASKKNPVVQSMGGENMVVSGPRTFRVWEAVLLVFVGSMASPLLYL
jgi:hypothetical protein